MNRKILKIAAAAAAMAIIVGLAWFANALVGNPVSKLLAKTAAKRYVAQTYADTDFTITRVGYDFKFPGYYVYVRSESSKDSAFTLTYNMTGTLLYDSYPSVVLSGWNTAYRLGNEYRELVDTVIESPDFPYQTSISYGDLEFYENPGENEYYPNAIQIGQLERDREYDNSELGAQAGHIVLYLENETIRMERMAEILLDLRERFDKAGISFYDIDLVLRGSGSNDGSSEEESRMEVRNFLYRDIYEEGMTERVRAAKEAADAYHEERDKERQQNEG